MHWRYVKNYQKFNHKFLEEYVAIKNLILDKELKNTTNINLKHEQGLKK